MATYVVTLDVAPDKATVPHTVDCEYFQLDLPFVHFKDASHKTVLAVRAADVLAVRRTDDPTT